MFLDSNNPTVSVTSGSPARKRVLLVRSKMVEPVRFSQISRFKALSRTCARAGDPSRGRPKSRTSQIFFEKNGFRRISSKRLFRGGTLISDTKLDGNSPPKRRRVVKTAEAIWNA